MKQEKECFFLLLFYTFFMEWLLTAKTVFILKTFLLHFSLCNINKSSSAYLSLMKRQISAIKRAFQE